MTILSQEHITIIGEFRSKTGDMLQEIASELEAALLDHDPNTSTGLLLLAQAELSGQIAHAMINMCGYDFGVLQGYIEEHPNAGERAKTEGLRLTYTARHTFRRGMEEFFEQGTGAGLSAARTAMEAAREVVGNAG